AGFVELTPQHQRLFAALRDAGTEMRLLDTLPEIDAGVARTASADPREEIAAALVWARERALARPESRIGIVIENLTARREEAVALAEELLCPAASLGESTSRAPFDVSLGPPLASVALVNTALDLIALADAPLDAGTAAALLRSPYLIGGESASARAQAERAWLCEGKREVTLGDAIGALDRCSSDLAARWRTARDLLHSMRRSSPREWSDAWRAWLSAAGWPGSRPLDSNEYQARVAWEKLLVDFASLGTVAPRLTQARALATLQTLASERSFQPEGGPASIQILGVLEGTGIAFDALWVCGLASDRWPSAPGPNPLLPLSWQRQRNVAHATADREREYAEALTARFARAAPEVVFSSAANVDDHALSPSALILAYPERAFLPPASSWIDAIAGSVELERIVDDRAPPLPPGSTAPGGASIVAAQSDCPFQAVARCRLRAEPWPAPRTGLTPLERGKLVHVTLAEFWTQVRDQATLLALDESALASRIGAAVDRALREVPASRWRDLPVLLRECEAKRLEGLVRAWLAVERTRPAFTAQALETRVVLELGGVEFSLRRDRVDALAAGGVAILDYKTGQVERPRQWFDERPRAAQIGLYTLVQSVAAPGSDVRAVGYVELRAEGVSVAGLSADPGAWAELDPIGIAPGGTWASLEGWWRQRLGALAEEIAAGHAAVAPRLRPSPCRNCGLQPVCRIESVRAVEPDEAADE
ncbi:MAG TPA: PD-(D/E)XK nuclease family protein, partial [Casimicrobiaceae bacterium]|nr:PD-(D/E)XK nuclease family protein [Casimicrobiaceae bacterium]